MASLVVLLVEKVIQK